MAQELLRREAIQPTKQIKPIQQMPQVQLIETADRILGKETPRSQVKKRAEEFISIQ